MGTHQIRHEVGFMSPESRKGWHASMALFTKLRLQSSSLPVTSVIVTRAMRLGWAK